MSVIHQCKQDSQRCGYVASAPAKRRPPAWRNTYLLAFVSFHKHRVPCQRSWWCQAVSPTRMHCTCYLRSHPHSRSGRMPKSQSLTDVCLAQQSIYVRRTGKQTDERQMKACTRRLPRMHRLPLGTVCPILNRPAFRTSDIDSYSLPLPIRFQGSYKPVSLTLQRQLAHVGRRAGCTVQFEPSNA
jgi:hypothetical protein